MVIVFHIFQSPSGCCRPDDAGSGKDPKPPRDSSTETSDISETPGTSAAPESQRNRNTSQDEEIQMHRTRTNRQLSAVLKKNQHSSDRNPLITVHATHTSGSITPSSKRDPSATCSTDGSLENAPLPTEPILTLNVPTSLSDGTFSPAYATFSSSNTNDTASNENGQASNTNDKPSDENGSSSNTNDVPSKENESSSKVTDQLLNASDRSSYK